MSFMQCINFNCIVDLKRFSQERYSRKISTLVNFPIKHLDLTEFAAEKGKQEIADQKLVSRDLIG